MLLVTKAVGDFFGINGIADEMIRFNGYPFLEKDDHAFHTAVSSVMRMELQTLPASGLCVRDVGKCPLSRLRNLPRFKYCADHILEQTDVKGFPIVDADQRRLLLGYIGRAELRYVIGATFESLYMSRF